ncbi:MAG: hypothetical protein RLZZ69_428, partial [Cyanobacteriota bacterium]
FVLRGELFTNRYYLGGQINLAIDPQSWKYVESLKLDYAEDLMGGGFRFHNPQNKKTCGCGISFPKSVSNSPGEKVS